MTGALEFVAMEVQPAEEQRAVAATKLLQSSDAGRQQRREYLKEHQSPRADYIKLADLLSRKLARYSTRLTQYISRQLHVQHNRCFLITKIKRCIIL